MFMKRKEKKNCEGENSPTYERYYMMVRTIIQRLNSNKNHHGSFMLGSFKEMDGKDSTSIKMRTLRNNHNSFNSKS